MSFRNSRRQRRGREYWIAVESRGVKLWRTFVDPKDLSRFRSSSLLIGDVNAPVGSEVGWGSGQVNRASVRCISSSPFHTLSISRTFFQMNLIDTLS